ncbi:MAG: HD domain-containing protein [Planctomycetes bacterium]|nr:HD domain-containing protein [Planctomycetota bacterium]
MRKIETSSLSTTRPLLYDVYHECGERLFEAGEKLSKKILELLAKCHISEVYEFNKVTDHKEYFQLKMLRMTLTIDEVHEGDASDQDIFDPKGKFQLASGEKISHQLIDRMRGWGVEKVFVRKTDRAVRRKQWETFAELKPKVIEAKVDLAELSIEVAQEYHRDSRNITKSHVLRALKKDDFILDDLRGRDTERIRNPHGGRDSTSLLISALYSETIKLSKARLKKLEAGETVDIREVEDVARNLVRGLHTDRQLFLSIPVLRKKPRQYLVEHQVSSAFITTALAKSLGFGLDQIISMITLAFLHDVGMLMVDRDSISSQGDLDKPARKDVARHLDHTIAMLRKTKNMPKVIPVTVYQVHERLDGSGYPQGTKGAKIHDFAKIVMVADIYDSLISKRPWRGPFTPHESITMVRNLAQAGKISKEVSDALRNTFGEYPIGSWVQLADRRVAKVIDVNPETPDKPVISIMIDPLKDKFEIADTGEGKAAILRGIESSVATVEALRQGFPR